MTLPRMEIDMSQVTAMAQAWRRAPNMVIEELTRASLEASLLLERETKERTPVGIGAGGGLKGSISARPPQVSGGVVTTQIGTSLAHAVPVELGTKPHFPPVAPLAEWARVKLGVPAEEARNVGFLIARKISRVGTKGAFMFTRAFADNRGPVLGIFEAAQRRIAERLATLPGGA